MSRYAMRAQGVFDNDAGVLLLPPAHGQPPPQAWLDYIAWIGAGNAPDALPSSPGPTVEQVRAEQLAQVNIERARRIAGGVSYAGHVYDSDDVSRANVTGTVAAVSAGVPLPDGFAWRTADNVDVPFDAPTLVALGAALLAHANACYANSWALKAALAAADDPASVDITAGWPA